MTALKRKQTKDALTEEMVGHARQAERALLALSTALRTNREVDRSAHALKLLHGLELLRGEIEAEKGCG